MAKAAGSGEEELFIRTMPPVPLSRWVNTPDTWPGMPPVCPTQVRLAAERIRKKPSPMAPPQPSGSTRSCGWHISSSVSADRMARVRVGHEAGPLREVGDGAGQGAAGSHRPQVEHRLDAGHVVERLHVVAGRARSVVEADRRPGHLQRVEDPGPQRLLPRAALEPLDELAQHGIHDVGVVPVLVGAADPLDGVEVAHQRRGVGLLQRLPDVAERLAGQTGRVREGLSHGGPLRHPRQVLVEGVVEVEPALVAQRHHQHRGEGLGVRGDEELVVGSGHARGVHVGGADAVGPHRLTVTHHRCREPGHAPRPLAVDREVTQLATGGVLECHVHPPTLPRVVVPLVARVRRVG